MSDIILVGFRDCIKSMWGGNGEVLNMCGQKPVKYRSNLREEH